MGLKNILRDKRVYFDTNIFIYLLEGSEHFQDALSDLEALIANEAIKIASCDLVYTEPTMRVFAPLRLSDVSCLQTTPITIGVDSGGQNRYS